MFTIILLYPEGCPGRGARETVRSSYIPPVGMKIHGSDSLYGKYVVVEVSGSSNGSILSDEIYATLEID